MSLKDTLIGLFIALVWGMNFVIIAWALDDLPPLLLAGARFMLVASVGCVFFRRPNIPWYWMASYALTISVGQFAFLFWAMHVGMPAGIASLVLQSQAIFTVILAVLFLRDGINSVQILALLAALVGLILIGHSFEHVELPMIGFGLTLIGAFCWAVGNIINRMIAQRGYRADVGLVVWSAWLASPVFFSLSWLFEGPKVITTSLLQVSWSTLAALLYLSIAASIIGFGLWGRLLSKYPASKVTPMSLAVPVFGIACAAYFLDETLSTNQLLGIGLVLSGLIVNSFSHSIRRGVGILKSTITRKLKPVEEQ